MKPSPHSFARAFVTGGSGYIGGELIERLVRDGVAVNGLARSEAAAQGISKRGAQVIRGDLDSVQAMTEGMKGVDLVVHCAATLSNATRDQFERVNVQGTRNVLAAARAAGVRRLLHIGTEAATMDGKPMVNIDETHPLQPRSAVLYTSTKAQAEQAVIAANGVGGLETVVMRPRLVWGRGDTTLLPEFVVAANSGKLVWVNGGNHLTSTTHIDNVLQGTILTAAHGRPGQAYFITDGDPVPLRWFITRLLETQGVTAPTRSVPRWAVAAGAAAGEALWRLLPLPGQPPIGRLEYWLIAMECTVDISKARNELGYRPVVTIDEGMEELSNLHRRKGAD